MQLQGGGFPGLARPVYGGGQGRTPRAGGRGEKTQAVVAVAWVAGAEVRGRQGQTRARGSKRSALDLSHSFNGLHGTLCRHLIRLSFLDTSSFLAKSRSVERFALSHAATSDPSQRASLVSVRPG